MFIRKWKLTVVPEAIKVIGRGYKVTTKFTRCGQILLTLSGIDKLKKSIRLLNGKGCWMNVVCGKLSEVDTAL